MDVPLLLVVLVLSRLFKSPVLVTISFAAESPSIESTNIDVKSSKYFIPALFPSSFSCLVNLDYCKAKVSITSVLKLISDASAAA
jgi:hypothetical protein